MRIGAGRPKSRRGYNSRNGKGNLGLVAGLIAVVQAMQGLRVETARKISDPSFYAKCGYQPFFAAKSMHIVSSFLIAGSPSWLGSPFFASAATAFAARYASLPD